MGGESLGESLPDFVLVEPYGEGDAETDQGSKGDVEVFEWEVLPDGTARDFVRIELVVHHGYDTEVLGRYACVVASKTSEFGEGLDGLFDSAADKRLRRVIWMR